MPRSELALYSTVYPGVEPYLAAWYASIAAQTDTRFDLWVGVDGLDTEAVGAGLNARGGPAIIWVTAEAGASSARIREVALTQMVETYAGIIFVDSDDCLLPSRVAAARTSLARHDLAGCALQVVDRRGANLGPVFGGDVPEDPRALLTRYNVFGLSNSVYRSEVLRACLPLPSGAVLIDWLLATRAVALGAAVGFDPTPRMLYRQHPANTAAVLPPFSAADVLRATGLVLGHYDHMLDGTWPLPVALRNELVQARAAVRDFHGAVTAEPARLATYVDALSHLPPRYLWWWLVAHPALEDVWRN